MVSDDSVAKALLVIASQPEGQIYLTFLREQLAKLDKKSRYMTGDDLLICNGQRINLEQQVSHFESAKEAVERISGNKPKAKGY